MRVRNPRRFFLGINWLDKYDISLQDADLLDNYWWQHFIVYKPAAILASLTKEIMTNLV
jgi:hypothetical protein